jgi:hypothetical protein
MGRTQQMPGGQRYRHGVRNPQQPQVEQRSRANQQRQPHDVQRFGERVSPWRAAHERRQGSLIEPAEKRVYWCSLPVEREGSALSERTRFHRCDNGCGDAVGVVVVWQCGMTTWRAGTARGGVAMW